MTDLALLVVYYVNEQRKGDILGLHLERIARHTATPYRIYGVAHRLAPELRARLRARPDVELCDVPVAEARGSLEHGVYLDALARRAFDDGASHLCTLDVDSFPLRDDWVDTMQTLAPSTTGVAGVLRRENGDTALPHPSCIWMPREFYAEYRPSFLPTSDGTREFSRFLRATRQRVDTGIRLGYLLWCLDLEWSKLLRTNAIDDHFLMAGVYADAVFHLGAAGRGRIFHRDIAESTVHRLSKPIARLPARGEVSRRAQKRVLATIRRRAERRISARNRASEQQIREALFADPDTYLSRLRTGTGPGPA